MKRLENCVMCSEEIDTDNEKYEVGESLGEYWCDSCAEFEKTHCGKFKS